MEALLAWDRGAGSRSTSMGSPLGARSGGARRGARSARRSTSMGTTAEVGRRAAGSGRRHAGLGGPGLGAMVV